MVAKNFNTYYKYCITQIRLVCHLPYLSVLIECRRMNFMNNMPWELLYADDLAVIAETEEELIKRLNDWKDNVESKGMRVNMNKTKWRTSEGEAEGCKTAMWGLQ